MEILPALLTALKQQVNAVEFDSDDLLLERNLKRALGQLTRVCNRSLEEIEEMAAGMSEIETDCGLPADFAGAVLELAAAMYRYGEAYSDSSYRFTPSFEMVMSRYRLHYQPKEG